MYKDKVGLLFFFCSFLGFSQVQKKVSDTVYVYEEVIVYDTVYVEKSFDKIKIDKIIIAPERKDEKPQITIIQNNKETKITVDALIIEKNNASFPWEYNAKLLGGFNSNSLFKEFDDKPQNYFGIGIYVKKTLFNPNFAVGIGFETTFSLNTLKGSQSNTSLNGFYFENDTIPRLFKSITNEGFQFQIPLQVYWKIKKIMPSVGILANISNYKSTFSGSSGNLPLALDENQSYTAKALFFGCLAQVDYQFTAKLSVGLRYSLSNSKKLFFTNGSDDGFSVARNSKQNSFGFSLGYIF